MICEGLIGDDEPSRKWFVFEARTGFSLRVKDPQSAESKPSDKTENDDDHGLPPDDPLNEQTQSKAIEPSKPPPPPQTDDTALNAQNHNQSPTDSTNPLHEEPQGNDDEKKSEDTNQETTSQSTDLS